MRDKVRDVPDQTADDVAEEMKSRVAEEVVVIAGAPGGRRASVHLMDCQGALRTTRDSIRDGRCMGTAPLGPRAEARSCST